MPTIDTDAPCNTSTLSSELKELLERTYGVQFSILDGRTGEVTAPAPGQPPWDWGPRVELCREVARRGRPEFLDDENPLLTLALPLVDAEGNSIVAVAAFLVRRVEPTDDVSRLAEVLGMRAEDVSTWVAAQTPWTPETLRRVTELVLDHAWAHQRAWDMQRETRDLSIDLAATYGEIRLLRQLTQNLTLAKDDEDLDRLALETELLAGIVRSLTSAIDAKDPYTCGHSDRVARVAVRLAEELGCDPKMRHTLYLAGLLHDIGKIGVDDGVLRKMGKLSEDEYQHIKQHVGIGHQILNDLTTLEDVLPVVLHHHESWDGDGYPHRLRSDRIPLLARIVAVADAFDAMSSDRPYRRRMPEETVDRILREGAGRQWDPEVIDAYFRVRDDIRRICGEKEKDEATAETPRR